MVYHRIRLTQWIRVLLGCMLLLGWNLSSAQAEPAVDPVVTYTKGNNSIVIGSDLGAEPRSQILTFSALKAALATNPEAAGILVDQGGGVWLLNANIVIKATASLQIVKSEPALTTLRIESLPFKSYYIEIQKGGQLLLNGMTVTSWDTANNKPDENITDQRSYIDAVDGSRLDILNSNVGYLGSGANAGTYGLSWRKRRVIGDVLSGATGEISNSILHHNFVGAYVSEGYGLKILNTEIHSNLSEGLLVKDNSQTIEAAQNKVHTNGTDGMNFIGSTALSIHDNKVYANARHGILLESAANDNVVDKNEAYNHAAGDGIAIALSKNNVVSNNNTHNNKNGIRISGSISVVANNNQVVTNTVTANENGIYLYAHGDRNLIRNNQVTQNTAYGVYIKSGGNRLEKNTVNNANAVGIGINADQPDGSPAPEAEISGSRNVIIGSTISDNAGIGIRITGGSNNSIGVDPNAPGVSNGNLIERNANNGISLSVGSTGIGTTDTLVSGNTLRENVSNGVLVTGAASLRNRITRNVITLNKSNAIRVDPGAQGNIQKPVITAVLADNEVQGTAVAGGIVEVYTDPAGEAQNFWGEAAVGGDGKWKFPLPAGQDPKNVTALTIDQSGNTSPISARSGNTAGPFYKVDKDETGQTTIFVTGDGETVTLSSIKTGLGISNTNLLNDLGNGLWELNSNLMIGTGVILDLTQASGLKELRLRSVPGVVAANTVVAASPEADLANNVYVRTHYGTINIEGVKIYSWDSGANGPDPDPTNGRAYIIAKYVAVMNINNAEISYLGSVVSTETRGVTWRDSNDPASPGVLLRRVTGQVVNSKFHHNYIGAYTVQAANILFENNQFYDNALHGLNIDDFSLGDGNDQTVEVKNNQAYNNVGHGFYLSRGVTNITLADNESYKNLGHGFLIDAGSSIPPSPSTNNSFSNNEAYENQQLGMRIIESNTNSVLNNRFYRNSGGGMSIEKKSTGNNIASNQLFENQKNGIDLRDTADANIVASNVISKNVDNGIYVRSSNNTVNSNIITGNLKAGVAFLSETGTPIQNNQFTANTVASNGTSGVDVRSASGTKLEGNKIYSNAQHGVYLTLGATGNLVVRNEIYNNTGAGIRCSDLSAFSNKWSENALYDNGAGGVAVTDGANSSISPAVSVSVKVRVVTGSAQPGATVEIFTDNNGQGRFYQGSTQVQADGKFTFTLATGKWKGGQITTVVVDPQGNASRFSSGVNAPAVPDEVFMPLVRR